MSEHTHIPRCPCFSCSVDWWKWTFFVCPIDIPPICKRGTHPCPNAYSAHNWTSGNYKKTEKTNSIYGEIDFRISALKHQQNVKDYMRLLSLWNMRFVHLLIRCGALWEEIRWARRHLETAPLISNFFALNNFWSLQLSSSWRPSCFLPLERGEALTKQLHERAEKNKHDQSGSLARFTKSFNFLNFCQIYWKF